MNKMNILAFDSSDEILSAALETEKGVWYSEIDAGSRHSELLMECIDGLVKSAGLSPPDLNAVVCAKGPGSFTGLRIGYSAAKGFCLALGIPLIAVPTLDCLANPLSMWPGLVIPAIDAKKGCFFTALYRGGALIGDYMDADPCTIATMVEKAALGSDEPIVLTGSGAGMLHSSLTAFIPRKDRIVHLTSRRGIAKEMLEIAKGGRYEGVNDIGSGPEYIRKSDADLNLG